MVTRTELIVNIPSIFSTLHLTDAGQTTIRLDTAFVCLERFANFAFTFSYDKSTERTSIRLDQNFRGSLWKSYS